ncbi:hypothetical protein [Pseudescherichia sp.]|uniref:hypothetical protein n=1 Tax=Pseudescherichia sp. TaxID=2055881 RepID=UPI0028A2B419|nr:hypothetical protein [Pseudescherichia sp.]
MSDKYAALIAAKPYALRFSRLWERYDEACHGNAEHMRDILELTLDALETAERRIVNSDRDVLALLAERDADKAKIAELAESHSKLRDTLAAIHNTIRMDGGYTPLAAILNASKRAHEKSAAAAAAAGISLKIEGE